MSGPATGSQCHVCQSPDAALINAALATGRSGRKVAIQFGLGKDPGVLRTVVREGEQNLGAYAVVLEGGPVRVGDDVVLLDT